MNSIRTFFFALILTSGCVAAPDATETTYSPLESMVSCRVDEITVYAGCCPEQGDYVISYERGPQAWGICTGETDIGVCGEDDVCVVYFPSMGQRTGTCVHSR